MYRSLLQDGGVGEVLGDAGLPLGGAGGVDAGVERVDGDGDGHVDDIELVDGFRPALGLADHAEQAGLARTWRVNLSMRGRWWGRRGR